ncbi:MAG: response regulator [Suipraeoptans sp.]
MNKKLRLLIIDDEIHIRTLLKYIINWDSLGIDICGEATCAEEGIMLLDELQPNIVFSDICMDYMDGIEFSTIAKKRYPYIRIVLLTGHSEFEFAARSIEAGVSAYLLKPLEENMIIETVTKLKKEIYHEQQKEAELNSIRDYLNKSSDFLIENNLNSLLVPYSDISNTIKRLSYFDITFSYPFFQIVTFIIHSSSEENDINPFVTSLDCHKILKNKLYCIPNLFLFFDLNHQNLLLSNNPDFDLLPVLEELKISILEQIDFPITIGVGQPVNNLSGITKSYSSAYESTRYRTILGNNQIIQYNYIPIYEDVSDFDLESFIQLLLVEIKSGNKESALQMIYDCFDSQIDADMIDIIPARITGSAIINHLTNMLIHNDMRDVDSFSFCMLAHQKLFRLETLKEFKNLVGNLTASIIQDVTNRHNTKTDSIMDSIIEYLDKNYDDCNLTLSSTAQKFYLNSSYLSRLFKQSNDSNFTKYLTSLRLKKAGELLLSTSLRAYEISEKVGFRDSKYFTLCFRKYYGETTKEFRISHASN